MYLEQLVLLRQRPVLALQGRHFLLQLFFRLLYLPKTVRVEKIRK
jgi:hypothetical protein